MDTTLPFDDAPIEQADGSALIPEMAAPEEQIPDFYENLAETLELSKLNSIAGNFLELIEKDREARKQRDEQYTEGLRRTGLGDDAPGGATFEGASKVVHPVLAEGCIDYAARAIKEIFPANGPVKTKVFGAVDSKKLDKARRKAEFLNWQLTNQIEEYRSEKETLLTQLPLGGSQYEKYWFDPTLGRIRMEFVPVDKVLLPFAAASFYTSPRITHLQDLTEDEFEGRMRSGFYTDIDELSSSDEVDETAAQKANDKIEGKSQDDNPDGVRLVYEISTTLDLEEEDDYAPYVLHIDAQTEKVVAIYRNWDETDEKRKKLDWWVEDKFIPWRGVYGIGLPHLIGGMAAAITGALRALLDSAHINNAPTAVKLKGGRASGQNTTVNITEVQEIDAPAGMDDIRKIMMPMPFNPPSNVLFQMLDWLTNQAKGVVATTEEKMDQIGDRTPVGTTMAMIEQGSATYAAIHARLHDSQRRALRIICRLNFTNPNLEDMARFGLVAEDFKENDDVEPVSDPNIFSESQRYAQLQEQVKLVQLFPELNWNKQELARRGLQLLKVDGIDAILPKAPEPFTGDPISENQKALLGTPLNATPEQDHIAHIQEHIRVLLDPMLGAGPLFPGPLLQNILANITQHVVFMYHAAAMTGAMLQMNMSGHGEKTAADGASMAMQYLQQRMPQLAEQLNQCAQLVQSKMPQPPIDPAVKASADAAAAETARRTAVDQQTFQLKQMEFQATQQNEAILMQIKQAEMTAKQQREAAEAALKQQDQQFRQMLDAAAQQADARVAEMAQQIELLKNQQDNEQHQRTEIIKNLQDNQTNLEIALKQQSETAPDFSPQIKMLNDALSSVEKQTSQESLGSVMQGLKGVIEHLSTPKMIIHDEQGRPIGISSASETTAVGVK
jgi:hypothetical protein